MMNLTFESGITIDRIIVSLLLVIFILNIYMAYRNYKVFKEREKIKKTIFVRDENNNYIYSESEVVELLSEMNKVASYYQMLLKVWVPVQQFYINFADKIEKGEIPKS